jgi:Predicted transcriptional regulator
MSRLDRISAMLIQLQSRPIVRAADMAERFGVSLRTIYRDIRTLSEAGIPICGDAGVGYSLVEGYRLPPLMFTREEAMSFLMAQKLIEQLTDSHNTLHFRQGMDKIRAVMRGVDKNDMSDMDSSIAVYRSRRMPAQKVPNLLQAILESINSSTILKMGYTNTNDFVSVREIEAVGITYSHPYWYLTAWCHLRSEYRTFRLDRINSLTVTAKPQTKEHPLLKSLVEYDDKVCLTEVIIRTSKEKAKQAADTNYFMGLVGEKELSDGRIEQTYMSYSIETMARWVLANADTTTLVSPPEVNELIKQIMKHIVL